MPEVKLEFLNIDKESFMGYLPLQPQTGHYINIEDKYFLIESVVQDVNLGAVKVNLVKPELFINKSNQKIYEMLGIVESATNDREGTPIVIYRDVENNNRYSRELEEFKEKFEIKRG